MSSSRCRLKLILTMAIVSMLAGCAPMGARAPQNDGQAAATKPAGGACRASDGSTIADGTVVYRCAVPGQGVTQCPRYVCQKCDGGTLSGEYTCQLQ